jgi:ribosomal protein L11 methyltransferase
VVGVENDPEALVSAREHARLNHVALRLVQGEAGAPLRPGAFDLVLANITAPLLRSRASEIAALVAPGGDLVVAGLLTEEAASVRAAYAALGSARERCDGEWSSLRFTLP